MEFILIFLAYIAFSILLGGLLTFLVGKIFGFEELTFVNSAGINVVFLFLNPFVPVLLFFLDYYLGLPTTFTGEGIAPNMQPVYWGLATSLLSIVLWLATLRYVFGWDLGQSCKFCFGQGCVGVVLVALLLVIAFMAISMFRGDDSKKGRGTPAAVTNPSGIDPGP